MMARFTMLAGAALLALGTLASPASAQDYQALQDQILRLQRELSDLERYVYASSGGDAAALPTGNVAASQEVRLQQLESELGRITGRLEELSFRIDQLAQQMERMNADIDFRLSALERGGGATTSDAGATQPAGETQTATTPPPATSSGTLGTIPQSELDAQLSAQPNVDAGSTGSSTVPTETSTASAITPYDLPGATPEEQYEYAFGLLRQANYKEAEAALSTFLDRHPDDLLAGNAQYWLGETYYVRGNYQQAAVTFAEGYQKYPNSGKAPDNLLKLAMSLGELGKSQEACVALGQLQKQFPNAPSNIQDRAARERQRHGC